VDFKLAGDLGDECDDRSDQLSAVSNQPEIEELKADG
jgi:hypothetical protein